MNKDKPWTTTTGDGAPITSSGCGYSAEEKRKIKEMRDNGTLRDTCPKCGHFWLRDYPIPVRQCQACGEKKPWADE